MAAQLPAGSGRRMPKMSAAKRGQEKSGPYPFACRGAEGLTGQSLSGWRDCSGKLRQSRKGPSGRKSGPPLQGAV